MTKQDVIRLAGWLCFGLSCGWAAWVALFGLPGGDSAWNAAYAAAFTGLGALILHRQPQNRAGLLLLTPIFLVVSEIGNALASAAPAVGRSSTSASAWAGWVAATYFLAFYPLAVLLPYLLPDGRLPSPRWRPAIIAGCALTGIGAVTEVLRASTGVRSSLFDLVIFVGAGVCGILGLYSMITRLRLARGASRSQVAWLLLGYLAFTSMRALQTVTQYLNWIQLPGPTQAAIDIISFVLYLALPVTWTIAILRYRLIELNPTLVRLLQFGVLALIFAALNLAVTSLLGIQSLLIVLIGVMLALLAPKTYDWLGVGVSRLVYGSGGSPHSSSTEMIRRIGSAPGPREVLEIVAGTVEEVLPPLIAIKVALSSRGTDLLSAARGAAGPILTHADGVTKVPVVFQTEEVGYISVKGSLDTADVTLLEEFSRAAAGSFAAAFRSSALQLAREQLLVAKEEERRRIARDIHDGVGPIIAGLGFILDALRSRLSDSSDLRAVTRARVQASEASQLIRRMSRDLRPTLVDQFGLVGALKQVVARYEGTALHVELQTDITTAPVDPAIEAAVFAIASEAITNVARHSAANHCRLSVMSSGDVVSIFVDDDGHGRQEGTEGVGIASMRERVTELNGHFNIEPSQLGGTQVHAEIPIRSNR